MARTVTYHLAADFKADNQSDITALTEEFRRENGDDWNFAGINLTERTAKFTRSEPDVEALQYDDAPSVSAHDEPREPRELRGSLTAGEILASILGVLIMASPVVLAAAFVIVPIFVGIRATKDSSATKAATTTPKPQPKPSVHHTPDVASKHSTHSAHDVAMAIPWGWLLFAVIALAAVVGCVWGVSVARSKASDMNAERRERIARRKALESAWEDLGKRLDSVTARWDAYESDPALFLTQPAIRDVSVPEVATAIRTLMDARARRSPHPGADVDDVADTAYYRSVVEAELAVAAAVKVTREMVRLGMSDDERKTLRRAQDLIALALDGGATHAERQSAYAQCVRLLERLGIELPTTTRAVIETSHPLLLESKRPDSATPST